MKELIKTISASFDTAHRALQRFMADEDSYATIAEVAAEIAQTFRAGGKCIIFGNGGSMCDANHFAEEFTGRFRSDRPALPCISISEPSHLSCVANDYGFDEVFARGVQAYAKAGDMVIGISTSGSSPNVIRAMQTAKDLDCKTFVLLGRDGGALKKCCDHQIIIPGETSDRIQEIHMMILHIIIECVEQILFP